MGMDGKCIIHYSWVESRMGLAGPRRCESQWCLDKSRWLWVTVVGGRGKRSSRGGGTGHRDGVGGNYHFGRQALW